MPSTFPISILPDLPYVKSVKKLRAIMATLDGTKKRQPHERASWSLTVCLLWPPERDKSSFWNHSFTNTNKVEKQNTLAALAPVSFSLAPSLYREPSFWKQRTPVEHHQLREKCASVRLEKKFLVSSKSEFFPAFSGRFGKWKHFS